MDKAGEKFTKANLPKAKAKVKKRELCGVSRTKSRPSAKRQKDSAQLNSVSVMKPRQQKGLSNQENRLTAIPAVVGLTKSKNPIFSTNRLRSLQSSKAKVSETVTSRKVLGELQANVEGLPPKNQQLRCDLQRVLGRNSSPIVAQAPPSLSGKVRPPVPRDGLSSSSSETDMEHSPPVKGAEVSSVPLEEISQRLVEGLQVDVIFPRSNYLENIKAELKKVLKQSNPFGYEGLVGYFSGSGPNLILPLIDHFELAKFSEVDTGGSSLLRVDEPSLFTLPSINSAGVSDVVALNLEVNTSALNINDQAQISPDSDHTPQPKDFLDTMDNIPAPPPPPPPLLTALSHDPISSSPDWTLTPTRPRMFPHKLY